jgi:hypothetical protein
MYGANLPGATMDEAARLRDIVLAVNTKPSDVAWNSAQLTRVGWPSHLGDEARIKRASKRRARVDACRNAIRAHSGFTKALEAQGLAPLHSAPACANISLSVLSSFASSSLASDSKGL